MSSVQLAHDPYNLIIAGVGGQGNVLASRVVGNMLSRKGLTITIGETFGGSQRGGSVMSHLRISDRHYYSPQIPKGKAHMILGLEPTETIRVLVNYGNPDVRAVCNMRPIHPVQVISGELGYPSLDDVRNWVRELSRESWFIDATDTALTMGAPILGNVIMVGALAGLGELPMDEADFEQVMAMTMTPDKVALNLKAYEKGKEMIAS
ncbi:MAG: indolepyruvate oxidoreductase subunit beta [Proteobacteria bacterium]|nr:indolepyruvate oxidoreductase subunit beta [Pseudomonadota bacterium]